MQTTPPFPQPLLEALRRSSGIDCLSIEPLPGGSNNQLFRLETRDGTPLVAKKYFVDDRDRLRREFELLSVLSEKGFPEVARPIARFDDLHTAVYSFLEGRQIPSSEFTRDHLEKITDYLAKLHGIRKTDVRQEISLAYMSARSLTEMIGLTRTRIAQFSEQTSESLSPNVRQFLEETPVIPLIESRLEAFIQHHNRTQLNHLIADKHLCLSSQDFGPQNMLWRPDGSLAVVDFEYGGWDHPLHAITGFPEHDKSQGMGDQNKELFIRLSLEKSPLPKEVLHELDEYRELTQLDWIMILLMSLHPGKIERLLHSRGSGYDIEAYEARQIQKVRERFERLIVRDI